MTFVKYHFVCAFSFGVINWYKSKQNKKTSCFLIAANMAPVDPLIKVLYIYQPEEGLEICELGSKKYISPQLFITLLCVAV